ncbi:Ankyrin repeat-containing domain protein [Lactarius tabidus]
MLKEIGKVNPLQAYRLLQCLTVATRPLRVEELAEVLAVDFDGAEDGIPTLNKDWRWDVEKQGVLSTCSSLIAVVRQQRFNRPDGFSSVQVVQFAHFSVKEFLTSDRLASLGADLSRFHIRLEPAHAVITQACLAVLLQSDSNDKVDAISPLHQYAARHWVDHARFENVSLLVEDGMRRLFDPSKPYLAGWLQSHNMDKRWRYFLSDSFSLEPHYTQKPTSYPVDFPPLSLYHASLCGFPDLVKYLISEYPQHVNAAVGFNKSPLVVALFNRHWRVAEVLYQNGADVDVTAFRNRTPLHAASDNGIVEIARWLLDHGADPNALAYDHTTPLHLAAAQGHFELVLILLEHGVDLDILTTECPSPFYEALIHNRTPLHQASEHGHIDIVRLLIQHGAEVNTHIQGLLNLASVSGVIETVQLFIELGADVNAPDGSGSHALHLASSRGHTNIMELLLEKGADVNSRDRCHRTPLHVALSSMHVALSSVSAQTVMPLMQNCVDMRDRTTTPICRSFSYCFSMGRM